MSETTRVVLVTGSRDWRNEGRVREVLGRFDWEGDCFLFHGGARGLDQIAGKVATELGWEVKVFPANWNEDGRAAGHRRNERMLAEAVEWANAMGVSLTVLAFKENFDCELRRGGTEDMVRRCKERGLHGTLVRK